MANYVHDSKDLTALMTSNSAPSPNVVSASEVNTPDHLAFKAFNHTNSGTTNYWRTNTATTGWLKFDFGTGNTKIVAEYTVSMMDDAGTFVAGNCPKTWTFQGSNNDSTWTTLGTQTDEAAWVNDEMRTYLSDNTTAYRYFRINVTVNHGGSALSIAELELMEVGRKLGTWANRRKLEISNANIDAALSNFPFQVKISASSGIGNTDITDIFTELSSNANRKKIAVTISDKLTQCYVEIERWDHAASEAYLSVKAPSVASGDVENLYIYYDNRQSDNTTYVGDIGDTAAQNVWDINFKLVTHMAQDPNGDVADSIKDSTSNAHHLSPYGSMTTADLVAGRIGKALDFDGNDYLEEPSHADFNITDYLTISTSINVNHTRLNGNDNFLFGKASWGSAQVGYLLGFNDAAMTNALECFVAKSHNNYIKRVIQNITEGWHDVVGVYDKDATGTAKLILYVDGVNVGSPTVMGLYDAIGTNALPVRVARDSHTYNFYANTQLDECSIAHTARSAAWVKAAHHSNRDNLVTYGPAEEFFVAASTEDATGLSDAVAIETPFWKETTDAAGLSDTVGASMPSTGTFYPTMGADDGYWAGSFNNSANNIWMGDFGVSSYNSFFRFHNVTIPNSATILSAYIRFTSYSGNSGGTIKLKMRMNDEDNASVPTNVTTANALTLTTAYTDWEFTDAWIDGTQYNSADIKSALQEVVDRAGWNSGNNAMAVLHENSGTPDYYRQSSAYEYLGGSEKVELHVMWESPIAGTITEAAGMSDAYATETPYREIQDICGMSDLFEVDELSVSIVGAFGTGDTFVCSSEQFVSIDNTMGMSDSGIGVFEYFRAFTEQFGTSDAYILTKVMPAEIEDAFGTSDDMVGLRVFVSTISQSLVIWDSGKLGWQKSIADAFAMSESVIKILGLPVKEWMNIKDSESNNWDGSEAVSDGLFMLDVSKLILAYTDLISDGMTVADASRAVLIMAITDILTFSGTFTCAGIFGYAVTDSMNIKDIVSKCFPKSVSDSFDITEVNSIDMFALLSLVDAMDMTDSSSPGLKISKTIEDTIDALDSVTAAQLLQELIRDGIDIEVIVEIDGELYECWVVNTSAFHVSVYSGYDYNSFAVMNNTVYGCKSDGLYELTGDTDDGAEFHSGIVLPQTKFGSEYNKRFRKAFFGVSGDNLIMNMETESGARTFSVVDTEMTITRDLKGRKWVIKLADFDSLESINLFPTILSRK